jgi:two-component system sensor histidine kinase PilS (NtrC family)
MLEGQMRKSERLAAVGELAAAIAHEIRNPLAAISGSVEMLEQMVEIEPQGQTLLQIVLREVERLDVLISEFLDYCRPTDLTIQDTDLGALIDDILTLFGNQSESVDIQWDGSAENEVLARVDPEAIRQVLWNILNNAAHAASESQSPRISVELNRTAARCVIAIEDSGYGIDPDTRARLFEPFFTTKPGGSGLGLAVSHRVVDEHHGLISVDEGRILSGARFEIRLPRATRSSSPPQGSP